MSVKPEIQGSGSAADMAKLTLAVLLLAGGIAGYYLAGSMSFYVRLGGMLGAVIVAIVIAMQTEFGRNAHRFSRASLMELRKVVWPTYQETVQTTVAVVAMTIILGILMWGLDSLLGFLLRLLMGHGS